MYANNSVHIGKLNIRSETKYFHFTFGRFRFGRFGVWPFWTFTVAILVSFTWPFRPWPFWLWPFWFVAVSDAIHMDK